MILQQSPKQIPETIWNESILVKKQHFAIMAVKDLFHENEFINNLKIWCEDGIRKYNDRAAPLTEKQLGKLKEMLISQSRGRADHVYQGWIERILYVIGALDSRNARKITVHFCPFCGENLDSAAFSHRISFHYCACGAIFIPMASLYLDPEKSGKVPGLIHTLETNKDWIFTQDQFYGEEFIGIKSRVLAASFHAIRNICPFCKEELKIYACGVVESSCGAVGIVNYHSRKLSYDFFEKWMKFSERQLVYKDSAIFGIFPDLTKVPIIQDQMSMELMHSNLSNHDLNGIQAENVRTLFAKPRPGARPVEFEASTSPKKQGQTVPQFPPLDFSGTQQSIEGIVERLEFALKNFNIAIKPINKGSVKTGPSIIRILIQLDETEKFATLLARKEDIERNVGTIGPVLMSHVRGTHFISLDFPRSVREEVTFNQLVSTPRWQQPSQPGELLFGVGISVDGAVVIGNLITYPHLLVAGMTRSGKTVFLESMLTALATRYSPRDLRIVIIDPKGYEFPQFHAIPHIAQVLTSQQDAMNCFKDMSTILFAERRKLFKKYHARNLKEFHLKCTETEKALTPYIVVVVDEIASLLTGSHNGMDAKNALLHLASMGAAFGIHLVLATQRPSSKIIDGDIKANISQRVCLRLPTAVDSRVVLDEDGAETLTKEGGDLLYGEVGSLMRLQGFYCGPDNISKASNTVSRCGICLIGVSAEEHEVLTPLPQIDEKFKVCGLCYRSVSEKGMNELELLASAGINFQVLDLKEKWAA